MKIKGWSLRYWIDIDFYAGGWDCMLEIIHSPNHRSGELAYLGKSKQAAENAGLYQVARHEAIR
jgi:hypothetical protein